MLELQAIEAADKAIRTEVGGAFETDCYLSEYLSSRTNGQVYLKCEHLQRTGSFKYRGALTKLLLSQQRKPGMKIIAASSGNHGLAIATAAKFLGLSADIYVPESASPMKCQAIQALGAQLVSVPGDGLQSELRARAVASEQGALFVSPYNDLEVIAGQATVGLELCRQVGSLDAVLVAVGGGGLSAGIGRCLSEHCPDAQLIGAWPEVAPAMYECLQAGEIHDVKEGATLSDGTAGGVEPGAVSFPLLQRYLSDSVLVSEAEIANAMRLTAEHERWMIEGAAGVAIAALLQDPERWSGKTVAIVVCGRNISLEKFEQVLRESP